MGHMSGSKFPDQEVTGGGLWCVSVCVRVCSPARIQAYEAGQCVRDKKIRTGDETWCQILALCH